MRTLTPLLTGMALAALLGCATTPSESASRINIISSDEARQYDYIGRIQGSSVLTGVARETGYQNALNEVLTKAAAEGAQFVVIDENSKPAYWTTSEVISAAAYKRKQ